MAEEVGATRGYSSLQLRHRRSEEVQTRNRFAAGKFELDVFKKYGGKLAATCVYLSRYRARYTTFYLHFLRHKLRERRFVDLTTRRLLEARVAQDQRSLVQKEGSRLVVIGIACFLNYITRR